MILKSLWRQKPLLKSQDFGRCYAGRGLRSGTPRWGYPSHRFRGGSPPLTKPRTATPLRRPQPASNVQMIVTNDELFPWLTTPIWHWLKKMPNDTAANYDVTRQTESRLQDKSSRNSGVVYVIGRKPIVFDPLGNGNLVLRINYQKVSQLNEIQEVASKWGLSRSA